MLAAYFQINTLKRNQGNDSGNYYSNLLCRKTDTCQNLTKKCRVCLQEGNSSIYEENSAAEIKEALQIFGNIIVSEDDGHTKLLCSTCKSFIKQAISFRKVAKRSEELLKKKILERMNHKVLYEHSDYNSPNTKEAEKWKDLEIKEPKKRIKPEKKEKVPCPICNKIFSKSYLNDHMTMHDPDQKKFVCHVCGRSFRLQCAYRNHSLRHGTGFPFKCKICPYRAQYALLLQRHMRTHTGDYRYLCTECPARFLEQSNLKTHMFKHREPQFQCDTCKRAFHTKRILQQHYQCDHLGIKNHECNICNKAFGTRNAMMKHQRGVHKREKISNGRLASYLKAENQLIG